MRFTSFLAVCFFFLGSLRGYESALAFEDTPSVTDDCTYCQLYGQHFRTKIDLYLFQEIGEPHYKYFGVSNHRPTKPAYLPAVISKSHIGHVYGTAKILAVVPAGSEFVVEAATHEVLVNSGETLGLQCRLFYNGKEVSGVGAEFIQVHTMLPDGRQDPHLDEAIAMRITK